MPAIDRLADLVDLVADDEDLFVRFGGPPSADHGGSVDYESGEQMPGFSANRLAPQPWWSRPLSDWVARQVRQYAHLADRSEDHASWVVKGRMTGRGPDDEPLLCDMVAVARLTPQLLDEARRVYESRFDPGRVSR